jgi:hypothetical protein
MTKLYRVDILEKASHGIYGKEQYTSWALSESNKQRACNFAEEIVAGMTWKELLQEWMPNRDDIFYKMRCPFGELYNTIGHENAERYFSYKASIEQ